MSFLPLIFTIFFISSNADCFSEKVDLMYAPSSEAQYYIDLLSSCPLAEACTTEECIIEQRDTVDLTTRSLTPPTGLTSTESVQIIVDSVNVTGYWIWKTTDTLATKRLMGTVLYTHGGAWTYGSFFGHRGIIDRFVAELDTVVFFVDYRLAPETKLPEQLKELKEGYKLILNAGVDPKKVMVMGESAGGHLSALLIQELKRNNKPLPGSVTLMSPALDLEYRFESWITRIWSDVLIPLPDKNYVVKFVVNNETYVSDPKVSPTYGGWKNFPPTLFIVSSDEALLSDTLHAATRIHARGGISKVIVAPHMLHAYPVFGDIPEAVIARAAVKRWFDSNKV